MNLHTPLELDKASTESISLVPTKKFFKPVLVITAPAGIEEAKVLGAEYLFNDKGLPREFEGAHKLHGELPGAKVTLTGKTVAQVISSEKVAHVSFYREEKRGMRLRIRIHLAENDQMLEELLAFLSQLNKDDFKLTIKDAQTSLLQMGGVPEEPPGGSGRDDSEYFPEPDLNGVYDVRKASARPFANKKLKAAIWTLETADGFIFGWMVDANKMADPRSGGRDLTTLNPACPAMSEAVERAVDEALAFVTSKSFTPEGKAEEKAAEELKAWLFDMAPSLSRRGPDAA